VVLVEAVVFVVRVLFVVMGITSPGEPRPSALGEPLASLPPDFVGSFRQPLHAPTSPGPA
jgi:hypothetical protein